MMFNFASLRMMRVTRWEKTNNSLFRWDCLVPRWNSYHHYLGIIIPGYSSSSSDTNTNSKNTLTRWGSSRCHDWRWIVTRSMAHVTGHKKQTSSSKKKSQTTKRATDQKGNQRGPRGPMLKKKRQYADPSTRPDYPLGPHHQPPHPSETAAAAVVVPPALMLPTASPHVFVAKVACQEANISARHLFASVDSNNNYKKKYRYEYFPPATFQRTFPSGKQPEVAFLGRSNVGKSSLMNALMRQPLAVTSKQPGRTQQAYYYGCIPTTNVASIGSHSLKSNAAATATGFLVDLPGYGYAVGPDSAVGSWQAATQDFLLQRRDTENLRRVFVLQDSRLRAPQAIDDIVVTWLEEADIAYTIVLTKADDSHLTAGVVKHVNLCSMRYQQLWSDATPTTATVHDHDDGKYTGQNVTEEEEEDDDQNQGMGVIMMSPIVHVTSAKKHTGIAEVLSSIETEFLADRLRATDQ